MHDAIDALHRKHLGQRHKHEGLRHKYAACEAHHAQRPALPQPPPVCLHVGPLPGEVALPEDGVLQVPDQSLQQQGHELEHELGAHHQVQGPHQQLGALQVDREALAHPGPHDLDHHRAVARPERRRVDLRDAGTRDRLAVEAREHRAKVIHPELGGHVAPDLVVGDPGHAGAVAGGYAEVAVLHDRVREEGWAVGHYLAELDQRAAERVRHCRDQGCCELTGVPEGQVSAQAHHGTLEAAQTRHSHRRRLHKQEVKDLHQKCSAIFSEDALGRLPGHQP